MCPAPLLSCARALVVLAGLCLFAAGRAGAEAGGQPRYADQPASAQPVLRLAVHPLHNPRKLVQAYQPLVDLLNRRVPGVRFELEASRDYAAFEAKFRHRGPELLLPNPWQALQAINAGYEVVAMAGEAADFHGLFIVRRDSPLRSPADLKGQAVAYPAPTAVAACLLPQWYLAEQGLDVMREVRHRFVGSQDSAILAALHGEVAAAATWPPPWRAFQKDHPLEAAQLRVVWQTAPLVNNAVMVRSDIDGTLRARIVTVLLALHRQAEGRAVLAGMQTGRIVPADDASYDPMRQFLVQFERRVRAVHTP